jgi:type VI secretion system protein ImpF
MTTRSPRPSDRLQPALLDRLIDEEPHTTVEPVERRFITRARLRQAVLRDLAWLFNAVRLDAVVDMSVAPWARRSVVNFGLAAFAGRPASSLEPLHVERAIRQAILDFEPRILPETLRVRAVHEGGRLDRHNIISVEIEGHLWGQPAPLDLRIRTHVDLESGRVELADLMPGPRGA